jgi:polysaccharide pyruvyl transferase WcaK-like protein
MALAGWTDVVVGMRLHALIFGAARAVPVVGVSYDPKVDALLQRLRSKPVGTTESLDAGEIVSAIEAALDDDETRRRPGSRSCPPVSSGAAAGGRRPWGRS